MTRLRALNEKLVNEPRVIAWLAVAVLQNKANDDMDGLVQIYANGRQCSLFWKSVEVFVEQVQRVNTTDAIIWLLCSVASLGASVVKGCLQSLRGGTKVLAAWSC